LARERVEEAAGRTATLAAATGPAAAPPPATDGLGYAAALRAVRVEGDLTRAAAPLVVQVHATSTVAEGRVPWGLGPHLAAGIEQARAVAGETDPEKLRRLAGDRPVVLVGRHLHRLPAARELVEALAATHQVTVVEMGWPGAWRPAGVRAFVATHGASHANGRAAAQTLGLTG
ncbi:glycoside hydrolase family 3 protein, partial [Micromonospora sp. XM-20-01]|nr:glycoside hydrolase family 3 protein [Micromonospora sp. XM-20-01]